jgi:RNA polymerase sporulation-specific sigma factor
MMNTSGSDNKKLNHLKDEALCALAQQGSREAENQLVLRYSRLVKACIRPYYLVGADKEDLYQEGMYGLSRAIRRFNPDKTQCFAPFAKLCIRSTVIDAVRSAGSEKNQPLNGFISIEKPLFEDTADPRPRISDFNADPEMLVIGLEEQKERMEKLFGILSDFEATVLALFLQGYSCEEMAEQLHRTQKSIENAVQRIRRKSSSIKR